MSKAAEALEEFELLKSFYQTSELKCADFLKALKSLRHTAGCFCEVSINNPAYAKHDDTCKNAMIILKKWGVN